MVKIRHLLERDGRYSARLSVPADLREIIGKRELVEALGADRRQALDRLPSVIAGFKAQIDAAREHVKADKPPVAGKRLLLHEIAVAHYRSELKIDDAARNRGMVDETLSSGRAVYDERLRRVVSGAAAGEEIEATIGWAVDQYAANQNIAAAEGTLGRVMLARALAQVQLEANARSTERDAGDYAGTPRLPLLTTPDKPDPKPFDPLEARRIHQDSERTVSDLLPRFLKERGVTSAVNGEYVVAVRMLEAHIGDDTPVYRIVRRDAIDFKNVLLDVPTHYGKRFPGLAMGEAIAANKKLRTPWPTLSAQTVNAKWLSRLHSFFGWMAANEILPDNPFAGVRVDAKRKETGPKRTEFAPGDLAKLFSGSHFPNGEVESEDAWAMLVALFTGLRPSEAAQLRLDSIRHERGIMCVVVEERTKTSTSRRFVPLHSTLIRLGIERRIANLRKAGETHLFPRWYADGMAARDKAMANASGLDGIAVTSLNEFFPRFIPKRFNVTYRKGCGISDPAKVFYSFRHTFKTGLARAGVDKATRDDLCGHDDDSAGAVYVHDVSIEALNEAIQKLKFDGVPL